MYSMFMLPRLREGRPEPAPGLKDLLSVGRRGDGELVTVLGHRPAGDLDALAVQDPHELAVRQRALGVFGLDHLLDLPLHRQGRDVVAVLAVDAAVEEEL